MMQVLDLNLASRPFRNNTLVWLGHAGAALLLIGFSVWNVRTFVSTGRAYRERKESMRDVEQRLADLDARETRAGAVIARFDLVDLGARADTANEFIARKALSWTRLFNRLETVVPPEVRTTAVRPLFQPGLNAEGAVVGEVVPVGLQGLARSLEAFLELERALITDPHFAQVEPLESDIRENGEVHFDLRFLYYPEGRDRGGESVDLPHVLEVASEEAATPDDLEALERAQAPPPPLAPPAREAGAPQPGGGAPPGAAPRRKR